MSQPPAPSAEVESSCDGAERGALWNAARAGSSAALGELFEECRQYLLRVAQEEVTRDLQSKGSASRRTSLAMMFKLAESASKKWRRLRGHEQITHVIQGHPIINGLIHQENAA